MKFEALSKNAIILVEEMLKNQNLVKLIEYGSLEPLGEKDIGHTGALVEEKVFITPFTGEVPAVEQTNVRVFFPDGRLRRRALLYPTVSFQIVVHKNLWLMKDAEGNKALRPYEIMAEIVNTFEDKSIKSLGVIHFIDFAYHHINNAWGVYTLEAQAMTI